MVHLEEESANEEKYVNSDNPDGTEGITKESICLARAIKDAQQVENCCYHCGSQNHFIHDCPLLVGAQGRPAFTLEGGDGTEEESPSSLKERQAMLKVPQDGKTPGVKCQTQTPFLNPDPFNLIGMGSRRT